VARINKIIFPLAHGIQVTPILVYWGWRIKKPGEPIRNLGRVQIVVGADVERWHPPLLSRTISHETQDAVWEKLKEYESGGPVSADGAIKMDEGRVDPMTS
jgi:hypothetical protein